MCYLVSLIILALAVAPLAAAPAAKKDSTARRVLSYAELFAEIQACKDTVYTLEHAEVKFNPNTDQRFDGYDPPDTIIVRPAVRLDDIEFTGIKWVHWDKIHFKKEFFLLNCSFPESLQTINSTFDGLVIISYVTAPNMIDFEDCTFRNGVTIVNTSNHLVGILGFADCTFTGEFPQRARWVATPTETEFLSLRIDRSAMEKTTVRISRCSFLNPSKQGKTLIADSEFRSLHMKDNTFDTDVILKGSTINNTLRIQNNHFNGTLDLTLLKHPGTNTICEWSEVAGKLVGSVGRPEQRYEAKSDSELADIYAYHRLLASYNDLYTIYKTRGDRESANGCYIAIKTIETRRATYLHRTTPTLETWFDWRLNELLATFSDYGTNPAKGLVYIFTVILGFTALYLVFPSEPDNLSRQTSFAFFHVVVGYFSTSTSLVTLSNHKRRRALDDLHNFRTTLELSRTEVPAFIAWLGAPLYGLNKGYISVSAWLISRFDIVPGRWNELSGRRKLWTSAAVGAYMIGFLAWGAVMRVVNAFALSINAFVTLGYGEIQAQGIARYLAVLEGAIGWFLLSIFSVSLISQLLQ